jgi:probable F420-dependent oxidoreductase
VAKVGLNCAGVWWPSECYQAVEELGFDSLWTGEHVLYHRPIHDAIPIVAGMAAVTKRVLIGPAAIIAPLRNPTLLAKELATIDSMSGGRLVVVAGAGGDYPKEFEACGVPLERLGRRMNETIEILRLYWQGEPFSYDGEIFQLDDVVIEPAPAQPGGPPIWIGGRSPASEKRAAVRGDGYIPYYLSAKRCAEAFAQIESRAAETRGSLPEGFTRGCHFHMCLDDSVERARERAIEDLSWRINKDFTPWVDEYCIYGDEERCLEQLLEFRDAGVEHFVICMIHDESIAPNPTLPGDRADVVLREIERYGRNILPALAGD